MSAFPLQPVIDALHDAGLSVSLAPSGRLVVSPGSRLNPDLRELVKVNKVALVDWLQAANDPIPAPEPLDDPSTWRELAMAYHHHHFKCAVCIASGRGAGYGPRCGAGTALWHTCQSAF